MRFWLKQIGIAFDQLINAILGGWADESISSRAWRLRHRSPYRGYRWLIDALFFVHEREHCRQSYEAERQRSQLPPELRC